jgi:hypothetical protein
MFLGSRRVESRPTTLFTAPTTRVRTTDAACPAFAAPARNACPAFDTLAFAARATACATTRPAFANPFANAFTPVFKANRAATNAKDPPPVGPAETTAATTIAAVVA